MIRSFDSEATEDLFNGVESKAARSIPRNLWPVARRKLDALNAATSLNDLKVPPGNNLHALTDDQAGRHAIRVNPQYRVTFRFDGGHAHEVRIEDHH